MEEHWRIPPPSVDLPAAIAELRGLARGGVQQQRQGQGQEVKGLKFIAGRLARLFDRNRRLKYAHISRVLIDNFSSQSNDSRNIKRRVYDAINVMVAAGLFRKVGDSLEKKQEQGFRERVEQLREELDEQYTQRQGVLAGRKQLLSALQRRKKRLGELLQRNRQAPHREKIANPVFISPGDGVDCVKLGNCQEVLCKVDTKRSGRRKAKSSRPTEILQNQEYLQYL